MRGEQNEHDQDYYYTRQNLMETTVQILKIQTGIATALVFSEHELHYYIWKNSS